MDKEKNIAWRDLYFVASEIIVSDHSPHEIL